jgi:hypothetical protein
MVMARNPSEAEGQGHGDRSTHYASARITMLSLVWSVISAVVGTVQA